MRLTRRGEIVTAIGFGVLILLGLGIAGWIQGF
jgi:hypothetical protein